MPKPLGDAKTPRVLWTRGKGCQELAELVAGAPAHRVHGDPADACLRERADLLVSRRLTPAFDLVDTAVPLDLDLELVDDVVAAVAGGPHSALAAGVAHRLGVALGVPASVVSAYRSEDDALGAAGVIDDLRVDHPAIEYRIMQANDMGDLVAHFGERTLIVFGAPGGTWFQRRVSGPGARLRSSAPAGSVVVQSAPRRVFQEMGDPVFVAPLLQAVDTLRIRPESTLAVADQGRLVGLVRRARLTELTPDSTVSDVMEDPLSVGHREPVEAARPLLPVFGPDPIPVVDDDQYLVGGLAPPAA